MDLGAGLAGLSATYPGYMAQEDQTALTRLNQIKQQEAAENMAVAPILGRGLQHLLTGQVPGQPGGGPQPPAPGQPSAPTAPPPQAGGAPTPQPPMTPMTPQTNEAYKRPVKYNVDTGAPEVTLQNVTKSLLAANPGLENNPGMLMRALTSPQVTAILDRQGKEDLAEMRKEMATQRLQMAKERLDESSRWHDLVHSDKGAAREDTKAWRDAQGSRTDRRLDQSDTREARLAANSAIRNDVLTQRLQMQQQDLQRKVAQGDRGIALKQLHEVTDALHKRASEIIQSNSVTSNMPEEDRKALLEEQRKAYEDQKRRIENVTGVPRPAATPAPGASSAPVATPGAPAAPAASSAPPLAMLKPNTVTHFDNGQSWTIGPDGQPKRVQ
jgi:hypothetical protein